MKARKALPLVLGLALAGGVAALAQTLDGLDLQAIERKSNAAAADAQALVEHVRHRADALAAEARETAEAGKTNYQNHAAAQASVAGASPLDRMMADIASDAARGEAPQFIVFASLAMPPESLKPLVRDTGRAGGAVVFRGFPGNSVKAFQQGMARVLDRGAASKAVGIDPRLFRAFDVSTVPAFVVVTSDFDLCDGFDCRTAVPPHDRLQGNVTVRYALEAFAGGGGPGARVAAAALRQMAATP